MAERRGHQSTFFGEPNAATNLVIDVAQLVERLNRTRHRRLLDTEAVSDFGDPYLVGLPFQLQDGLEIVLLRGGEVARVLGTSGCFLPMAVCRTRILRSGILLTLE